MGCFLLSGIINLTHCSIRHGIRFQNRLRENWSDFLLLCILVAFYRFARNPFHRHKMTVVILDSFGAISSCSDASFDVHGIKFMPLVAMQNIFEHGLQIDRVHEIKGRRKCFYILSVILIQFTMYNTCSD